MTANTIEREIFIRAGIERVWSLVSKAGFWVGEELDFSYVVEEGGSVTVNVEEGSFPVLVERLDAPRYAAYRWASGVAGVAPTAENSTLVEFSLTEQDGGVLLRLKESGFAEIPGGAANYEDNSFGWPKQLERLQQVAESVPVQ